jgi:hypothetical protein
MVNNAAKSFEILSINLNALLNYFDGLIKLFPNLYLAEVLNKYGKNIFSAQK